MVQHTDKNYEAELTLLKDKILRMGGVVETMIAKSIKALVERDSHLARDIINGDREVNVLQVAIDDLCLRLLALHQPAASDLRLITIGLRISTDLERMGDLAVNISERVLELNKEPQLKPYNDLPAMARKTQEMVQQALDAFVHWNADKAWDVLKSDDEIDQLNARIIQELITLMQNDSNAVTRGVRLLLISRHLERIADHATNIAEEVIFMVEGRDIRHGGR